MDEKKKESLRMAVRFLYDLQKLRVSSGNRSTENVEVTELSEQDKSFMTKMSGGLEDLEKDALKEVSRLLKGEPLYENFFKVRPDQRGVGPTMAGLIMAEVDIARCNTPSQLWRFLGLAVIDGKAERKRKGEKAHFNPWLKSKMVSVLADCMIKANSPWRKLFDDYRHRKQHQLVPVCMACEGKGEVSWAAVEEIEGGRRDEAFEDQLASKRADPEYDLMMREALAEVEESAISKKKKKPVPCKNCGGTGGPAPWGRSDMHRMLAAKRFMVKQFLLKMWLAWRELEGLPTRVPYAAEYLGRVHHG